MAKFCNVNKAQELIVKDILKRNDINLTKNIRLENDTVWVYTNDGISKPQSYKIAERIKEKLSRERDILVSLDTTYSDTTGVNILVKKAKMAEAEDMVNAKEVFENDYLPEVVERTESNEYIFDGEVYPSMEDVKKAARENTKYFGQFLSSGHPFTRQMIDQKEKVREDVFDKFGITVGDTIGSIMEQMPKSLQKVYTDVRERNPDLDFQIIFGDNNFYDADLNLIQISIQETTALAQVSNLPLKTVLEIVLHHELTHAATSYAITNSSVISSQIEDLFRKVEAKIKNTPFNDQLRNGFKYSNGNPYGLKYKPNGQPDLDEFITEAFTNPYFKDYVQNIKDKEGISLWDKIIDAIRKFFGLSGKIPSVYSELQKIYESEQLIMNNYNANQDDFTVNYFEKFMNPNNNFSSIENLLVMNNVQEVLKDNIGNFVKAFTKIKNDFRRKDEQGVVNEFSKFTEENKNYSEKLSVLLSDLYTVSQVLKRQESQLRDNLKELEKREKDENIKLPVEKIELLAQAKIKLEAFEDYTKFINEVRNQFISEDINLDHLLKTAEDKILTDPKYKSEKNKVARDKEISSVRSAFRQLNDLFSYSNSYSNFLNDLINRYEENPIYDWLYSAVDPATGIETTRIKAEIEDLKLKKINAPVSKKNFYTKRINQLEKDLSRTPDNPEFFKKELQGLFGDIDMAVAWTNAASASDSPTIQLLRQIITNSEVEAIRKAQVFENEAQGIENEFLKATNKGNLDVAAKNKDLIQQIEDPTEVDEEGKIVESIKRDAFLRNYKPEFLTEYLRLKLWLQTLRKSMGNLSVEEEDKLKSLQEKYAGAKEAMTKFIEDHTVKKFTKEWYDNEAILDQTVKVGDKELSLKDYRNDVYRQIEELEQSRDDTHDEVLKKNYEDELRTLYVMRRGLQSTIGKEPGSLEYEVAVLLKKYSETRRTMGKYLLTDSSLAYFESLKKIQSANIDKEQYKKWLEDNTVVKIKDQWYEKQKALSEQITKIQQQISEKLGMDMPKVDRKQFYDYIKEASNRYRDDFDGVIDGTLVDEEIRANIKKQQEDLEELYRNADSLTKLSRIELDELYNKDTPVQRKIELSLKQKQVSENKQKVEVELTQLNKILAQLAEMSVSSVTEAYEQEVERQKELIESTITDEEVDSYFNRKLGNLYVIDGSTIQLKEPTDKVDGELIIFVPLDNGGIEKEFIKLSKTDNIPEIVKYQIKTLLKDQKYKQSQWYKDNHFKKVSFDADLQTMVEKDEPIYVWKQTRPSDEEDIEYEYPNYKYLKFVHNKEAFNKDYKKIPAGLPQVRPGSTYYNGTYDRLDNASRKYLDFMVASQYQVDESYPYQERLGDFVPSARRHGSEAMVHTTQNLGTNFKGIAGWFKEAFVATDALLQEEGIYNKEERNKTRKIPTFFNYKIKSEEQSKNLMGLVLMRNFASQRRSALMEIQTPLESVLAVSKKYEKTEVSKKSILNLKNTQSLRSRQIEELLLTELYGEKSKNSGKIGKLSVDKIISRTLGFAAKRSFVGNIVSPVVNTVGANVQSFINSNLKTGVYSRAAKIWAEKEFSRLMINGSLISDYAKFGKKSYVGQLIDYYNALPGERMNHLGHKAQWNAIKNFTEILTSPKDFSEYQVTVTQFLAFMKHTKVPGTNTSLIDAYELNKQGNIHQKTEFDDKKFLSKLYDLQLKVNGAYRDDQKNMAQKYALGKMAFFMSQYLVSGFRHRYGGLFSDKTWSTVNDRMEEGFYTTSVRYIKDLFRYGHREVWDNLTDYEKDNIFKAAKESAIILTISILLAALGMAGDDDKDKTLGRKLLLVYLSRISQEAQTWNPIAGSDDMLRKLKNPFIFTQTLITGRNVLALIPATLYGSDDAFYQKRSGIHQSGDSKLLSNFLKLISITPSSALGLDIDAMYKVQKMNYNNTTIR